MVGTWRSRPLTLPSQALRCSIVPTDYELGPLTYAYSQQWDTTPTAIRSVSCLGAMSRQCMTTSCTSHMTPCVLQVYTGCTSGAPPAPIEELTIAQAHEYFLNGMPHCQLSSMVDKLGG